MVNRLLPVLLLLSCSDPAHRRTNELQAMLWAESIGVWNSKQHCEDEYRGSYCNVSWDENGHKRIVKLACHTYSGCTMVKGSP
jgi:hypothetical protein